MKARSFMKFVAVAFFVTLCTASVEAQARCNPRENCTREGPRVPCPTLRKPFRTCPSYFDDPICLTRRTACQGELRVCVTSGLVGYGAGASCIGCVAAGAITTGGAAAVGCVGVCGLAASAIEQVMNHCGA